MLILKLLKCDFVSFSFYTELNGGKIPRKEKYIKQKYFDKSINSNNL